MGGHFAAMMMWRSGRVAAAAAATATVSVPVRRLAATHAAAAAPLGHYEELGVPRTATAKEIKAAYYRSSLRHHPDRNPAGDAAEVHARFARITAAYEVLGDEDTRRAYDRSLDVDVAGVPAADGSGGRRPPTSSSFSSFRARRAPSASSLRFHADTHYEEHYGREARTSRQRRQAEQAEQEAQQRQHARSTVWEVGALIFLLVFLAQQATRRRRQREEGR
jgi:DnaJ-class molecular chaperone